ncbi:MAG: hypothetical protein ACLPH5_14685, partial [Candidatus Sulfotelmatobacter sp.]
MGKKLRVVTVTRIASSSSKAVLFAAAMCFAMSIGLWAQAAPERSAPAPASHTAQPAQTSDASAATRPHDASFVIGNDDV